MSKPFHIGMFMSFSAPEWRGPWASSAVPLREWGSGEYYIDVARQMERAGFDFLMFADSPAVSKGFGGTQDSSFKHGAGIRMDPFPLMVALARETKHIGLIATGSTTFYPPYIMARLTATLDHLTGGRVAWNVVTSSGDMAALNHGLDAMPEHDERYAIADEFLELCAKLWDSWEPDALVADRDSGYLADPAKVHTVDHVGKYFRSRGPLNMPAGPQGHPLLCQAGGSEAGRNVASKWADIVVATNPNIDYLKEYVADIKQRAVAHGRRAEDLRVMFQISPVIAETDAAAAEYYDKKFGMRDPIQVEQTLARVSGQTGIDFTQFDLDAPFPQGLQTNGHASILDDWSKRSIGRTLRESLFERAQFGPTVHGTAASVADQLAAIIDETDGDGFLFMFPFTRRYVDEMCSGLVPELARRGLIRPEYTGTTFRDNIFAY